MSFRLLPALAAITLIVAGCGAGPTAVRAAESAAAAPKVKALDPAKFFANPQAQALAPGAFAQQPEALEALKVIDKQAPRERQALINAIRADKQLKSGVMRFASLKWEERLPLLKRLMALEARVMGFEAPPLVLGEGNSRSAFFDFDPAKPGTGTVMLFPEGLAEESNPYAALLLTIHETRHSAQFQRAFGPGPKDAAALGYKAAFEAQKALAGKLSFCDFCSLLNEHEAFQTANYVVGALTDWKVDTHDMGCLSSQFDQAGRPVIDLLALARTEGPAGVLAAFNRLERPQFVRFGGQPTR